MGISNYKNDRVIGVGALPVYSNLPSDVNWIHIQSNCKTYAKYFLLFNFLGQRNLIQKLDKGGELLQTFFQLNTRYKIFFFTTQQVKLAACRVKN